MKGDDNMLLKQSLIMALCVASVSFSAQTKLQLGYEFNRDLTHNSSVDTGKKLKNGISIGAEEIFNNQGKWGFGVGTEHKSSYNSKHIKSKKDDIKLYNNTNIYVLGKYNAVKSNDNNLLYFAGRAGYGIAKTKSGVKDEGIKAKGGLYYGAGIGSEIGNTSIEFAIDRNDITLHNTKLDTKSHSHSTSYGLKVGYTFGKPKKVKYHQYIPAQKAPVTKNIEPEKVTIDTPAEYGELPFSCNLTDYVCTIKGFKVDGKRPANEKEIESIKKIADTINKFSKGGSIDIVGHTDNTGSREYNKRLSVERASQMASLLRENGLSSSIAIDKILGYGFEYPIDTNSNDAGRYNNRRVDLFFRNVDFINVKLKNE
mgnify:FL=1